MCRLAAVSLLLACGALLAQDAPPAVSPTGEKPIQVEVNVVNIPVTVKDTEGRFVIDLNKTDFKVYEDGEPVEIRYFTKSNDQENKPPLHVGFLVDLSNSARLDYKTYKNSIGDLAFALIPEVGKSNNKGFLFGYHTEVDMLVDVTSDPYLLSEKMENLKHGGGSTLLDAIYMACTKKLRSVPYQGAGEPRKAVVVVGDGHDNASKVSLEEVIAAAQREQVTVYAVSTVAWGQHQEEEQNLYKLAEATGGRVVQPMQKVHKDVSGYLSKPQDAGNFVYTVGTGEYAQAQLQALYSAISSIHGEVQAQYLLGYNPLTPFSDGRFRKVRVELNLPAEVEVTYRPGYYPPAN